MGKWLNGARERKREIDGKDTSYAQYAPFVYEGVMYFTRQAVVSAEHQQPGSTGMEAIYGVRPIPDGQRLHG